MDYDMWVDQNIYRGNLFHIARLVDLTTARAIHAIYITLAVVTFTQH